MVDICPDIGNNIGMIANYLTVHQAAAVIGCTPGRVRQLCRSGQLSAELFTGRSWAIRASSAKKYAERKVSRGRPRISARDESS
jgi:excisionase family DNA binding protein